MRQLCAESVSLAGLGPAAGCLCTDQIVAPLGPRAVDVGIGVTALGHIRVPALEIKAGRDRVISTAATRRMVQALPGATQIGIDGPHLLLQTHPAECAAAVLQFLSFSTKVGDS